MLIYLFLQLNADDNGDETSERVLDQMEKIDDDCDKHGIQFVKIDDNKANKEYGIDKVSTSMERITNYFDVTFNTLMYFHFKMSVINIVVSEVCVGHRFCFTAQELSLALSLELAHVLPTRSRILLLTVPN